MANDLNVSSTKQREAGFKLPLFFLLITLYSGSYDFSRIFSTTVEIELKYLLIIPTLFTTLLATTSVRRPTRHGGDLTFLLLFSIFILISLISTLWLKANPYTIAYILEMIWVFVFSIIAYMLAIRVNNDEILFIAKVIVFVGSVFMVAGFLSDPTGQGRISAFGGGPNVYVRIVLMAFLFAMYLYVKEKRTFYLVLAPPLLIAALLSGSRGGIIALFVTAVFLILLYVKRPKQLFRLFLIGSGAGLVAFLYLYLNPATWAWVESRFLDTLFGEEVYTSGRDSLYQRGIEVFQDSPLFGIGISGYAGLVEGGHPHNLFIEVAVSTGVMGLSILVMMLSYVGVAFFRDWNHEVDVLVFFLGFIFIIISSQFSGSFFDTRFAWIFVFFALGIMKRNQNLDAIAAAGISRGQLK